MPFNDSYRFVKWLLTAPLLLIEILLVMKLVLISGLLTFIAVYNHIRGFNSCVDAYSYAGRIG